MLKGQYAFNLRGYNTSGFMAEIGSFTADGKGNITAGTVDSNGSLNVQSGSVTTAGSSYSVGSDNRGCLTIATPFYTFTTRIALETPSTVATAGAIEEWEPGPSPYIAAGEVVLQQSIPATVPSGGWVFEQLGIYSTSQYRTASVGVLNFSNGTVTGGEYHSNVEGYIHNYTGLSGSYTTPSKTTGRFTTTTTLSGVTAHRVAYLISGTKFLELVTDAPGSSIAVLQGESQLASGALTISGNLGFYATARDLSNNGLVEFGRVTVGSSNNLNTTLYENDGGTWAQPVTYPCSYTIDSYGALITSGSNCETTAPVFYLYGPNSGYGMGLDSSVPVGKLEAQTATAVTPGAYFVGTQEVVILNATTEIGVMTLSTAGYTGTGDTTSVNALQQADQPLTSTFTMNSDGTFSISNNPGVTSGMVISASRIITVGHANSAIPTILVIGTGPID